MATNLINTVKQFGYLRNKDIAALLFTDDVRKAQRATSAAVKAGELIEKRGAGANPTRFAVPADAALLETITGHRDASNSLLIDALVTGVATRIVPDREIQLHQAEYTLAGKIPDGLLLDEYSRDEGRRTDYTWVEVENSERSGRDVAVLGNWLMQQFLSTGNWHVLPKYRHTLLREGYLATVLIVISSDAAAKIESRLMSYIEREYPAEAEFIAEVLPQRLQFIRV